MAHGLIVYNFRSDSYQSVISVSNDTHPDNVTTIKLRRIFKQSISFTQDEICMLENDFGNLMKEFF